MARDLDSLRETILNSLNLDATPVKTRSTTYRVGDYLIHTRVKRSPSNGMKFPFNYGKAALSCHYELWICGGGGDYYLIPISVLKKMYEDPAAYPDYSRPNLRVATVDLETDAVVYASGGKTLSLQNYRNVCF